MARDGSGNYSLAAGNPVVAGTTITDTWANTTLNDIASALTYSIAKDGQTVPTANLPMGGYRLTGLGDGAATGQAVVFGQSTDARVGGNWGVGVTLSAWGAGVKAIQTGASGTGSTAIWDASNNTYIGNGLYFDGTNYKYIANSFPSALYSAASGRHLWYSAAGGTANSAATLNTNMTLDANGQLGLGVTPSAWTTGAKVLQTGASNVGTTALWDYSNNTFLTNGVYFDGTNYKYIANSFPSTRYTASGGSHVFSTAAGGAAGSAATFSQVFALDSNGRIYGSSLHNNAAGVSGTTSQYIASGTYTPTITAVGNVSASSALASQWIRVGNVVSVSGEVSITATAGGSSLSWRITLPVASTIANQGQLAGTGVGGTLNIVNIYGDIASGQASFTASAPGSGSSVAYSFTFQYEVK